MYYSLGKHVPKMIKNDNPGFARYYKFCDSGGIDNAWIGVKFAVDRHSGSACFLVKLKRHLQSV